MHEGSEIIGQFIINIMREDTIRTIKSVGMQQMISQRHCIEQTAITIGERYCTPDVPMPEEELIDELERTEPFFGKGIARIL
jgi:hypothetical protein